MKISLQKSDSTFLTLLAMMEHHSGMENLSVLVLDNDPTSLLLISDRLEQLNFKVFSFQTEHAALDFLKKGTAKEEELDLILAEVHVSTMSSRTLADSELLSHIMNELHVPFVSMCANDDEEAISECMAIGACFHLTKPLTTGSFNMLRHTARQHKSRMTTPEGSNTFYRTVSSSTKMPKETLNLRREELHHRESEKHEEPEVCKERDHSNKPDQLRLKAYGHPKKSNRLVWTVELHEKFLEAIEVLGGKYAVPSRILKQMNVKNLTLMHVASHLQKHRLRQPKANQDWKFQQNVNSKPAPLLVRSEHIAFTTESITPRVAADIREVYPSRLSTNIKKMSAEPAALEAYSYTRTPGIFRNDTMTVWDKYHKSLKNDFYWSSIRHRYEQSAKSKDIARGEGVSSEDPKIAGEMSYGGAPFESPGSNSLLTSCLGQIEKTNLTEIAGNNNNVGNTAVMDPSDALLDDTIKSSSAQMYLTGPADNLEEMNSFWMSQMEGPEGQLNIKPEDLLQVDEAWNEALVLGTKPSLINVVEPMTREATVGFTLPDPVMQFAQTQEAATGDAPMPDPVMQFPQTQEAAAEDAPMPDPVMQFAQTQEASVRDAPPPVLDYAALFAQDDIYCGWSPLVGDYDILL